MNSKAVACRLPLPQDIAMGHSSLGGDPVKDGIEFVCAQAMSEGVHSSDVILNILARQRDPGPAATILTPDALTLRHAPVADCARYDQLRSA